MQPISRISLVDESTTPMDLVACGTGGVVPLAADVSVPAVSADAQICEGEAAGEIRREASSQASELSTGKMNPQTPGWTKRCAPQSR